MTDNQILILIALFFLAGILFFTGYWTGRRDAYEKGLIDGEDTPSRKHNVALGELRTELANLQGDLRKERVIANWALAVAAIGEKEHPVLVEIADQLKLASATFTALKSQSQANRSLALRNSALEIAARLLPSTEEQAA